MNDDFLYRLRKEPSPDFAKKLKSRLDRQSPVSLRGRRSWGLYGFVALLMGGSALAVMFIADQRPKEAAAVRAMPEPAAIAEVVTVPAQIKQPLKSSWMWGDGEAQSSTVSAPAERTQPYFVSSWPAAIANPSSRIQRAGDTDAFRLLCQSGDARRPSAAFVLRKITAREMEACEQSRISPLFEMKVGYEVIVLVRDAAQSVLPLSRRDIFLALAAEIPDPARTGRFIDNPYVTWQQVNASLPDEKIQVVAPTYGSATYDAFVRLVLEGGCAAFPEIKALRRSDFARYNAVCRTLRKDDARIQSADSDETTVRRLAGRPLALGVLNYRTVQQSGARFTTLALDGVRVTDETLENGAYSASRALYVYAQRSPLDIAPLLLRKEAFPLKTFQLATLTGR